MAVGEREEISNEGMRKSKVSKRKRKRGEKEKVIKK